MEGKDVDEGNVDTDMTFSYIDGEFKHIGRPWAHTGLVQTWKTNSHTDMSIR